MQAIRIRNFGGPEQLELVEVPQPRLAPGEVLVRVHAAALNRADLLQRRGLYPPPAGASDILGLECAGEVAEVHESVSPDCLGQRVMALLPGGGYAEYVAIPSRMLMPLPDTLDFQEGAAIPEAFLTAQEALTTLAEVVPGERVLIQAAASGVGSAAIQLAVRYGAEVVACASSDDKLSLAKALGAGHVFSVDELELPERVAALCGDTGQAGSLDIVLDFLGARYLSAHVRALRNRGRLVVIGLLTGAKAELDLRRVQSERLQLLGLVMRTRPLSDKIAMVAQFMRENLPLIADGTLKPVIDSVFPLREVRQAHTRMEARQNLGKIVLKVR